VDLRERRVWKMGGLVRMRKDKVDSPACVLCLKSTHCLGKMAFSIRVILSHTKNVGMI
jgi:hypothetical protein